MLGSSNAFEQAREYLEWMWRSSILRIIGFVLCHPERSDPPAGGRDESLDYALDRLRRGISLLKKNILIKFNLKSGNIIANFSFRQKGSYPHGEKMI